MAHIQARTAKNVSTNPNSFTGVHAYVMQACLHVISLKVASAASSKHQWKII